ncbi:prim-pol domain-containing protein [Lentinula edodes]|uniref:prim-pol domain-containing protein n=1 Tax=Lentinula edodes TaxID=5353 RepID=UPI001E8D1905|nr:prim-pol domain-containing protein [Lentinula edodes]KAH7878270.1 prim-pol domain-containing protein [Lentinula edodes]
MAPSSDIDIDPASEEVLLTFYRRLYPFKQLFKWLNRGPERAEKESRLFPYREFAFTLRNDAYLRYNSYSSDVEMKKHVCLLTPSRFEIGPVYSVQPKDKKTVRPTHFRAEKREVVFDIDMTDYDPIRTCCSEANICKRCWGFIAIAVEVLDTAIRDQFGYTKLLWVYSGRRGIHLWISDKEAFELNDDQRKAMVEYLTVIKNGKEPGKRVNVRFGRKDLPPTLKEACQAINQNFDNLILQDQDCFGSQEGYETLLSLIPDAKLASRLREKWSQKPDSPSYIKWDEMRTEILALKDKHARRNMRYAMEDILLQYAYPRLDAEVSKHRNHLLKAPFCIHPKTGRICVPIDPNRIREFDPATVPTVGQLLAELDTARSDTSGGERRDDWQRTSLKPYIDMFEEYANHVQEKQTKIDLVWRRRRFKTFK